MSEKPTVASTKARRKAAQMEAIAKNKATARALFEAGQKATPWPIHPDVAARAVAPEPRGLPKQVKAFKDINEYDSAPARCGNCKHGHHPRRILLNSIPVKNIPMMCVLATFPTNPNAICNAWTGRDGSTLATN